MEVGTFLPRIGECTLDSQRCGSELFVFQQFLWILVCVFCIWKEHKLQIWRDLILGPFTGIDTNQWSVCLDVRHRQKNVVADDVFSFHALWFGSLASVRATRYYSFQLGFCTMYCNGVYHHNTEMNEWMKVFPQPWSHCQKKKKRGQKDMSDTFMHTHLRSSSELRAQPAAGSG